MMKNRNNSGFTLIELLIVIAIIGFLAAAILVAVDPVKRVQQSRDATRWSEVNGLLNAILTKQVDDRAAFYGHASAPILYDVTDGQIIVRGDTTAVNCATLATECPALPVLNTNLAPGSNTSDLPCVARIDDLVGDGNTESYIAEIPIDPIGSGNIPEGGTIALSDINTGYYIHKFPNGRIEIGSCWPEEEATISVKR